MKFYQNIVLCWTRCFLVIYGTLDSDSGILGYWESFTMWKGTLFVTVVWFFDGDFLEVV